MWRAWKSCYRNKSARRQLAGRTIAARLNSSRLSRNRTSEDAVGIHTDQKNGVRIHCVGRELEGRGRRERGGQRQGVWSRAWRGDRERPLELNIEEPCRCSELVEVHDAAGVIPRGRVQIQLADKVYFVTNYSAPSEGKIPRQGGGRDGTGCLLQNCAIACDTAVRLLKNGLRRRDQVKNEGKCSHCCIRPSYRAASKLISIHRVGARHSSSRQEGYVTAVIFVEGHVCDIPSAVSSEAACRRNASAWAAASKQKRKAAIQRSDCKWRTLLSERVPGERLKRMDTDEPQASGINDIERKIVSSNVRGAAAVRGAVAVRIHLIERARRKRLLIGRGTIDIGIKQPIADATAAIRTEPPNNGSGNGRARGIVYAGEVKDVSSGNRRIGKRRRVLPLKRAASRSIHVGLRNEAPGR